MTAPRTISPTNGLAPYPTSSEIRKWRSDFPPGTGLFSKGIYVAVEGAAELIRDKATFKQHWTSDLDKWFDDGVDTPGIVLIRGKAKRVTCWKGREEGEVEL
jgi:hypothetical protein